MPDQHSKLPFPPPSKVRLICQYHIQLFPSCGMSLKVRKEAAGNILLLYIICTQKEGTDLLLGNYFLRKKNQNPNTGINILVKSNLFVEGLSLLHRNCQKANPKEAKAMEQKH